MSRSIALLPTLACAALLLPPTVPLAHAAPPDVTMPGKPPSSARPGIDLPAGGPSTPGVVNLPGDPCSGVRKIQLPMTDVWFSRLAGPWATTIAGASKVSRNLDVKLRTTKRRVIVEVDGLVASHDPGGGQTGYYARTHRANLLQIPGACEIASISQTRGALTDAGPPTGESVSLYGTGVVDYAGCRDTVDDPGNALADVPQCIVHFRPIEVRLRPAEVTCASVRLSPDALAVEAGYHYGGDDDLDGARVDVGYGVQVHADPSDGTVKALGTLAMRQTTGDHTHYFTKSNVEQTLFDVRLDAPGCRIKHDVSLQGWLRTVTPPGSDARPQVYTPAGGTGGALRNVWCSTGRPGSEENVGYGTAMYCARPSFEPIVVELVPDRRRRRARTRVGR